MTSADRVARARSLQTPDDAVLLYESWAADYDHDVFDVMGFTGTERIADLLAAHVPDRNQPVIDLGCGTGAAGARLSDHGFDSIDGVDISPAMLQVAARRGVYRHLVAADLTQPMSIEHRYGASISAGTFTTGHVGTRTRSPRSSPCCNRARSLRGSSPNRCGRRSARRWSNRACAWCMSRSSRSAVTARPSR